MKNQQSFRKKWKRQYENMQKEKINLDNIYSIYNIVCPYQPRRCRSFYWQAFELRNLEILKEKHIRLHIILVFSVTHYRTLWDITKQLKALQLYRIVQN